MTEIWLYWRDFCELPSLLLQNVESKPKVKGRHDDIIALMKHLPNRCDSQTTTWTRTHGLLVKYLPLSCSYWRGRATAFCLEQKCYVDGLNVLVNDFHDFFFFPTKVSLIVGFILSRFRSKPRPNSRSFWNRCIFLDFYSATTDKDTHRAHDHKPNSGQEARRSLWSLVRGCCFIDWMKTQQTQS